MCCHSTKRCSGSPTSGMSRRLDMRSQSLCPEDNRSESLLRRFSWERRWKHFESAAGWIFRQVTILKISLLSSPDETPCFRRSPSLRKSFGAILPKQQRHYLRNRDFSTYFQDLS